MGTVAESTICPLHDNYVSSLQQLLEVLLLLPTTTTTTTKYHPACSAVKLAAAKNGHHANKMQMQNQTGDVPGLHCVPSMCVL